MFQTVILASNDKMHYGDVVCGVSQIENLKFTLSTMAYFFLGCYRRGIELILKHATCVNHIG